MTSVLALLGGLWHQARSFAIPLLVAMAAVGVVLLFPREDGQRHSFPVSSPPPAASSAKVHIAGAVQRPGVYALTEGDRIDDALRLAGGPAGDANLDALNLATRLRDGQQVVIPRRGEPATGVLLNINTASKALLETLPDIGEVRAQRIVDSRTADGPYLEPQDLVTRKIITDQILSKLRDRITVQ